MGFQYEITKRSRRCSVCGRTIEGSTRILVYKYKFEYIPRFYFSATREKTFNFCKSCSRSASAKLPVIIRNYTGGMRQTGFRSGGYVGSANEPAEKSKKTKPTGCLVIILMLLSGLMTIMFLTIEAYALINALRK